MSESIEEILKHLHDQADATTQTVLKAYNADRDHEVNREALVKNSGEYLESCAAFLKIKLLNEYNKKLYANKSALADRIILMLESLFPTTCQDCNCDYTIKLNDPEPVIRCFFCLQGSHNCKERTEAIEKLRNLPAQYLMGMVWLCHSCHNKNNNLQSKQIAHTQIPEVQVSNPTPQADERAICENYRKGKCIHGITGKKVHKGKECDYKHPKKCMRWCRHGKDPKLGCTRGKDCDKFHPTMCRFAVRNGLCQNVTCTFVHPKGTKLKDQALIANEQYPSNNAFQHPWYSNSQNLQGLQTSEQENPHYYIPNYSIPSYLNPRLNRYATTTPNNGFRFNKADFPLLNAPNQKRNASNDENPFLSVINMIKNMETKFASQIASLQTSLSDLAPSMPMQGYPGYQNQAQELGPQLNYIPCQQQGSQQRSQPK